MAILKAVRGTRDLLPPENRRGSGTASKPPPAPSSPATASARSAPPASKTTELFARGVGEETDIVSKEMYTWDDRERFDDKALLDTWTKVQVDEKKFVIEEAHQLVDDLKLGVQRIMGRRNPEKPEFVCFRYQVTSEASEKPKKLKKQSARKVDLNIRPMLTTLEDLDQLYA